MHTSDSYRGWGALHGISHPFPPSSFTDSTVYFVSFSHPKCLHLFVLKTMILYETRTAYSYCNRICLHGRNIHTNTVVGDHLGNMHRRRPMSARYFDLCTCISYTAALTAMYMHVYYTHLQHNNEQAMYKNTTCLYIHVHSSVCGCTYYGLYMYLCSWYM